MNSIPIKCCCCCSFPGDYSSHQHLTTCKKKNPTSLGMGKKNDRSLIIPNSYGCCQMSSNQCFSFMSDKPTLCLPTRAVCWLPPFSMSINRMPFMSMGHNSHQACKPNYGHLQPVSASTSSTRFFPPKQFCEWTIRQVRPEPPSHNGSFQLRYPPKSSVCPLLSSNERCWNHQFTKESHVQYCHLKKLPPASQSFNENKPNGPAAITGIKISHQIDSQGLKSTLSCTSPLPIDFSTSSIIEVPTIGTFNKNGSCVNDGVIMRSPHDLQNLKPSSSFGFQNRCRKPTFPKKRISSLKNCIDSIGLISTSSNTGPLPIDFCTRSKIEEPTIIGTINTDGSSVDEGDIEWSPHDLPKLMPSITFGPRQRCRKSISPKKRIRSSKNYFTPTKACDWNAECSSTRFYVPGEATEITLEMGSLSEKAKNSSTIVTKVVSGSSISRDHPEYLILFCDDKYFMIQTNILVKVSPVVEAFLNYCCPLPGYDGNGYMELVGVSSTVLESLLKFVSGDPTYDDQVLCSDEMKNVTHKLKINIQSSWNKIHLIP